MSTIFIAKVTTEVEPDWDGVYSGTTVLGYCKTREGAQAKIDECEYIKEVLAEAKENGWRVTYENEYDPAAFRVTSQEYREVSATKYVAEKWRWYRPSIEEVELFD